MAKHSKRSSRRRSTHRKGRRFAQHKASRFAQRGGDGYGYQGVAFAPAGSMAPIESRVGFSHCGFPARPGSLVGGARRSRTRRNQRGGGCSSCSASTVLLAQAQKGGGGGTGGYGFDLTSNVMGKEYAGLTVGSCPGPERPGAQVGGADMMDTRAVDSYSAGYGYAPASAVEVGHGTAHYLNQISYGRQCMGGGARHKGSRFTSRKGSRSAQRRRGSKKSRKGSHRR